MKIVHCLCDIALCHVIGDGRSGVVGFLQRQFTDTSRKFEQALQRSNDRAWTALEVALSGPPSMWQRARNFFSSDDVNEISEHIKSFLDSIPLRSIEDTEKAREGCLTELRDAKKRSLLLGSSLQIEQFTEHHAQKWKDLTNPQSLVESEQQKLNALIQELKSANLQWLPWLLSKTQVADTYLIVMAAEYFFRREVETDPELFRGLSMTQVDAVRQEQIKGFRHLNHVIEKHETCLNKLLSSLDHLNEKVKVIGDKVLDIEEEMKKGFDQLYNMLTKLLNQAQMSNRPLSPSDSCSLSNAHEKRQVQELIAKHDQLSDSEKLARPALSNGIGKAAFAAEEYHVARQHFGTLANSLTDRAAKGEAYFNFYQTVLNQKDWSSALKAIQGASQLSQQDYEPFPMSQYEPLKILGAGGFGVTFLCRDRHLGNQVAIKVLKEGDLSNHASSAAREATALNSLHHRFIIGFRQFNYADERKQRPYLVTEYFEGETLEEIVNRDGPLSQTEVKELALMIAETLQFAHEQNVLHRDVKPANILIKRQDKKWDLRIIDFGLARVKLAISDLTSTISAAGSMTGTIDYAAPEQLGKVNAEIGPVADIYGFGRTCCFALFGTPNPNAQHWDQLTKTYKDWLTLCLHNSPDDRSSSFKELEPVIKKSRVRATKGKSNINRKPCLIVVQGRSLDKRYELSEGAHFIGRPSTGSRLDINMEELENPETIYASTRHAKITIEEGKAQIQDLGSTNGTRINGHPLVSNKVYRVNDGDTIIIGSVVFRYQGLS